MSIWGPLAERFESSKPQRKMLALDGGGIRGLSTLEILSGWAGAQIFVYANTLNTSAAPARARSSPPEPPEACRWRVRGFLTREHIILG
jgi:hypothetical protein